MGRIDILFYDLFVALTIMITSFTLFMTVQLISYRGFGFNIYKTILKYMNKELYYERR